MRYTKLLTIVWYKVGSVKDKPSEEEYLVLTSMGVSIVLLSVSLARSRISTTYFFTEKEDNLWVRKLPQNPINIKDNPNPSFQIV